MNALNCDYDLKY